MIGKSFFNSVFGETSTTMSGLQRCMRLGSAPISITTISLRLYETTPKVRLLNEMQLTRSENAPIVQLNLICWLCIGMKMYHADFALTCWLT